DQPAGSDAPSPRADGVSSAALPHEVPTPITSQGGRRFFVLTLIAHVRPPGAGFQPGFHQALRWSESFGSATTFRLKVPVGRAGGKLRLSFRAGDGSA